MSEMSLEVPDILHLPIEARFARMAGVRPLCSFIWTLPPELIEVDDHKVAVHQLGPEDGTPVLSFHGNPGSARGPHPTPALLEEENIRLIAFDAPGLGESQPVLTDTPFVTSGNTAKSVIEALGYEKVAVWARSGGVPRALGFAALHPECVSNIVLVAGLAPPTADIDWLAGMTQSNDKLFNTAKKKSQLIPAELSQIIMGLMQDENYLIQDHLWPEMSEFDKIIFEFQPDLYVSTAAGHVAGVRQNPMGWAQYIAAATQPWGFDLSDVRALTLIIHGRHDPYADIEHARWLHRNINGAEILEIEGAHFANWLQVRRQLIHLRERHLSVSMAGTDERAISSTFRLETDFSLQRSFENYV